MILFYPVSTLSWNPLESVLCGQNRIIGPMLRSPAPSEGPLEGGNNHPGSVIEIVGLRVNEEIMRMIFTTKSDFVMTAFGAAGVIMAQPSHPINDEFSRTSLWPCHKSIFPENHDLCSVMGSSDEEPIFYGRWILLVFLNKLHLSYGVPVGVGLAPCCAHGEEFFFG